MMVTFSRIIKYGWQSFLRNGLLSISTISIMVLALVVFEGLILFNVVTKGAVQSIQEKVDISVYFRSNASEDSILDIKRSLEGLSEVSFAEYVSRDEALDDFKIRHADDDTVIQTLEELDENPLLASLNVKASNLNQYGTIAEYLEAPVLQELVEKVTYAQNKIVIDRLSAFVRTLDRGALLLTLFLTLLAILITFNTIRLAIFSNKEQISIMRLVGGSDNLVRGPYVVEGILYGIIAAIIGFVILIPVINFTSPHIANFILEVDLKDYFAGNWGTLLFYQLLFGIGLGFVSSTIAVRRYLRA